MSRRLFPRSLLRGIFDVSREIRMLTSPHQASPASGNQTVSLLHLPDVQAPTQYLVDMGLRPALARRISSVYMDFVSRYRQVFESHFHRVHRGCPHPEYYRDIFVVQFRDTIQAWASRIMSNALVWLCQVGLPPTSSCPQRIDVRVDAAMKAQILSRLGLRASFNMNNRANAIELPKEECKAEGDSSTKTPPASLPPALKPITFSTRDFFSSEMSSTCFPAYYPPPPGEPTTSPQKTLVTQFTTSTKNERPRANCSVDMSLLITHLGRMSVTTCEVGLKAQENRGCGWTPRSKKPEPLTPLLSPVVAGVSSSPPKPQSLTTTTVLPAKPITAPRKRRIAALPTRHTKTTALPILDPSSSSVDLPVSPPASNNATLPAPFSWVANMTVTEETPIDSITSSAVTSQYVTSSRAQYTTGTSDTVKSKSILSERRKRLPLPRRVAFQPQATQSQRQRLTLTPAAPVQSTLFTTVSRTPSLVSDTSSYVDSSSSSDEFGTPPSTPPSNSDDLASYNGLAENDGIPSKFYTTKPVGLPILGFPNPRKGEGVHFGFTNGDAVGEHQLGFTVGA